MVSGARCRLAYGPADATATHCLLLQYNPDGFTFLLPAHPGSPGQRAITWVCVWHSYFSKIVSYSQYVHLFNGPFSGTTRVSQYQKGKTNLDFAEARDSEWQWHQLGHVQVCTSLQTEPCQHPTTQFFTGRMPFLPYSQVLVFIMHCAWYANADLLV